MDDDFCGTGRGGSCCGAYVASGSILRHTSGWTTRTPATSCYVGGTMKAELLKVGKNENAEITVRDAGGRFSVYLVGSGSISVTLSNKKRKKIVSKTL